MSAVSFSILTVTRNASAGIVPTARSLRGQVGVSVQWVIKDGNSTDDTIDAARAYEPDLLLVHRDTGIYDAMNQALALATGDWIFFLNAADEFCDEEVLRDVGVVLASHPDAEIVFGDVLYAGIAGVHRKRFHWVTRRRLLFGDLCHQAVFVRRSLFQRIGLFDASLRWNADFDWFIRAVRAGARLHYLHRDIARFDDAGAHVQAGASSEAERNTVRARYLPLPIWRLGNWALRAEFKLRRLAGQTV